MEEGYLAPAVTIWDAEHNRIGELLGEVKKRVTTA
jgi:hypothetical protein